MVRTAAVSRAFGSNLVTGGKTVTAISLAPVAAKTLELEDRIADAPRGIVHHHVLSLPQPFLDQDRYRLARFSLSQCTLIIIIFLIVFIYSIEMRGIQDVDLFWQLKYGQIMLKTSGLCKTDSFSYTHFGESVPCVCLLSQLIYALLFRMGSWRALLIVHSVMFALAFGIAGQVARKAGARPFSVSAGMALGFLTGVTNSDLRPQCFGLCCFAILMMLLSSELRWRVRLPLVLLTVLVWQNAHPSVVLGTIAAAGIVTADWMNWLRHRRQRKPWELTLLLIPITLSQFATPMGIGIVGMNRDNLTVARSWLRESEWLPPWDPAVDLAVVAYFWIAVGTTIVLFALARKRVSLRQLFTLGSMTLVALYATRFVLFWGVAMVPIWADWIDAIMPKDSFRWGHDPAPRRSSIAVLIGGVILIFLVPANLRSSIFDDRLPLDGIRQLKVALPRGRIYNFRQFGGPLIFEGSPEWRVAIDGRLFVYTNSADWREYGDAATGRVSLDDLVRRHRPDAFFLHPVLQKPLVDALRRTRNWKSVYENPNAIAFIRS